MRKDGEYFLRYRAFNILYRVSDNPPFPVVAECLGGPFKVYSTKDFPGLRASTDLTKVCSSSRPVFLVVAVYEKIILPRWYVAYIAVRDPRECPRKRAQAAQKCAYAMDPQRIAACAICAFYITRRPKRWCSDDANDNAEDVAFILRFVWLA